MKKKIKITKVRSLITETKPQSLVFNEPTGATLDHEATVFSVGLLTESFGNGELNTLRDKINEIIRIISR